VSSLREINNDLKIQLRKEKDLEDLETDIPGADQHLTDDYDNPHSQKERKRSRPSQDSDKVKLLQRFKSDLHFP